MNFKVKFLFGMLSWGLIAGCEMPDTHPLPAGKSTGLVPLPQILEPLEGEAKGRDALSEALATGR